MAGSVILASKLILKAALPGVQVDSKEPNPSAMPSRYIRLTRAGGPRGRDIDRATLLVECFASTAAKSPDGPQAEQDAYALADALRLASSGGPWAGSHVAGWEQNSIVDFPDPDLSTHARWQFTGTLYVLT
ncbi:hypothetical protein [Williamsia serinedens]|uniref:hypothetical protein n=1 Tax=Williamsia serinedens TaxID=391736 RepID=UPI002FE8678A